VCETEKTKINGKEAEVDPYKKEKNVP